MARLRVGYRQLFDGLGCSLQDRDEFRCDTRFGEVGVRLYLGPSPKFGLDLSEGDQFAVPGRKNLILKTNYSRDVSTLDHETELFVEVFAFREIEVDEEFLKEFTEGKGNTRAEAIAKAQDQPEELVRAVDLCVGSLGLMGHQQLVLKPLNNNFVAEGVDDVVAVNLIGDWVQLLEGVELTRVGQDGLCWTLEQISAASEEARSAAATSLYWYFKALREREPLNRYVALFIPLELLLAGVGGPQPDLRRHGRAIRRLIKRHAGEEAEELVRFLDGLIESRGPSIEVRFQDMAEEARLEGWEADIAAFSEFNRMRNDLLHRGERGIRLSVEIGQDDTRELEALVRKYLNWNLFRKVEPDSLAEVQSAKPPGTSG